MKFSLIGVSGKDIVDCNPTLTLALVWQLMRAYTLAILSRMSDDGHQVVDDEIIVWAKGKVSSKEICTYIYRSYFCGNSVSAFDLQFYTKCRN